MAYPSTLSNITNPNPTDKLNSPSHSSIHTATNTAISEVQAYLGLTGNSSTEGTLIYQIQSPDSNGGGHVQSANKGGTGQTTYNKGNLLVASSSSVLTKLAVGSDGLALVADSAEATGVGWSDVVGNFSGPGSDGDVTISADTTLASDKYYNSLTVNSTKILNSGGYVIFVKGAVQNAGIIRNNGGAGFNGSVSATLPTLSSGGVGGASAAGVTFTTGTIGGDGKGGSTGAPGTGDAGLSRVPALGSNGSRGGSGGGTGSRDSGLAGSILSETLGGSFGAVPSSVFLASSVTTISDLFVFRGSQSSLLLSTSAGSSGGGGGSGDGVNQQGGGGGGAGGSGGVLMIIAKSITNTGSIIAAGGVGGNGGNGSGGAYGGGGGAGGPGGVVILAYRTLTDSGTIEAPGGAAGAGGTGGAGSGSVGGVGLSGKVYKIKIA